MTHVFVETSFLRSVFGLPHQKRPEATRLWDRFLIRELRLHIPFLCFQEALSAIRKQPGININTLRQIQAALAESKDNEWTPTSVSHFIDDIEAYIRVERSGDIGRKLAAAMRTLGGGVIHGTDEVFEMMPLDLDHDLEYNDHLILSSILSRAGSVTGDSLSYFCSTDAAHMAPEIVGANGVVNVRRKLKKLYDDRSLIYLESFAVPA